MSARPLASVTALVLGSLIAGCSGDRMGEDTAGDRLCIEPFMGPVTIEAASATCSSETQVRFAVDTTGWTSGATVFTQATGLAGVQWADEHELTTYKFGECAEYDNLDVELATSQDVADWTPDQSTAFACEQDNAESELEYRPAGEAAGLLTYLVRAYDGDGFLADCVVFGHDPQGLLDGTHTRALDPSEPGELEDGACRILEGDDEDTTTTTTTDTTTP